MAKSPEQGAGPDFPATPASRSPSTPDAATPVDPATGHGDVMAGLRLLVEALEQQWLTVTSGGFRPDACATMAQLSHTLVGRAASFDLPAVADLADFVNTVIVGLQGEQPTLPREEQNGVAIALKRMAELLRGSRINLPATLPLAARGAIRQPLSPRLYLVDDDDAQAQQLAVQLTAHGFSVDTFNDWESLMQRLGDRVPDAIVADVAFPEGNLAGIEAVSLVKQSAAYEVPVVFLSVKGDTGTRLAALRAGGQAYFTKPAWMPSLAAKLHELTGDSRRPHRILLVDDDQEVLELQQTLLMAQGFEVQGLHDPRRLMEAALRFRPEVVVLDLHMPGANGLELARVLRQDEAFFQVPVVFLSADQDRQVHRQALSEGGVDFLGKPMDAMEIGAILRIRAGYYRRMRVRGDYLDRTDPVTGLYNRSYLTTQLEQQPVTSGTARRGLGILYIELDNFLPVMRCTSAEELNRLRERVARIIKSHLLGDDLAACYNDHVFVVLTWRGGIDELLALARILCTDIASNQNDPSRPITLTASIGIYRAEDHDYKKALANAALACAYAHQDGGNRFYLHDDIQLQQSLVEQKHHWLQQIKKALSEQRFFLVYQPITSFNSEESHRYEVFLRMLDDNDEVILPGQFLGIVRQLGLLPTLDRWVVAHALRDLLAQQQLHPETMFFIKLSESSLTDTRFADWLEQALQRVAIRPGSCAFELPDRVVHAQQEAMGRLALRLRRWHCPLVVEGIGDGDLWRQLIGRLPMQYIKLARAITRNLEKNRSQQEALQAILQAARKHDIKVIASYVENASCLAYLYQHQVDLIQGYFLQAPDRTIGGEVDAGVS